MRKVRTINFRGGAHHGGLHGKVKNHIEHGLEQNVVNAGCNVIDKVIPNIVITLDIVDQRSNKQDCRQTHGNCPGERQGQKDVETTEKHRHSLSERFAQRQLVQDPMLSHGKMRCFRLNDGMVIG